MNLDVKHAFVLADWMKAAERCHSERELYLLLASERSRVQALKEPELDQIIGKDPHRLKRFEEWEWTLDDQFDLANVFPNGRSLRTQV